jgi:hypothetical protein
MVHRDINGRIINQLSPTKVSDFFWNEAELWVLNYNMGVCQTLIKDQT